MNTVSYGSGLTADRSIYGGSSAAYLRIMRFAIIRGNIGACRKTESSINYVEIRTHWAIFKVAIGNRFAQLVVVIAAIRKCLTTDGMDTALP